MNLNYARRCYARVVRRNKEVIAALEACRTHHEWRRLCKSGQFSGSMWEWNNSHKFWNFDESFPPTIVIRDGDKGAIMYHSVSGNFFFNGQSYTLACVKDARNGAFLTNQEIQSLLNNK